MLTTVEKYLATSVPRSQMGAVGIQIYKPGKMTWTKKITLVRNAPYTIATPHRGQIEARLHFADIARGGRGKRGLDKETGLPKTAAIVKKGMVKFRAPSRKKGRYPSQTQSTFRTAEQLRSYLKSQYGVEWGARTE